MSHDEALGLARAAMPFWAPWLPLLSIPLAYLLGFATSRVALAIGIRAYDAPPEGAHWTERARAASVARTVLATAGTLEMVMLTVILPHGNEVSYVPPSLTRALIFFAGLASVTAAWSTLSRRLGMPAGGLVNGLRSMAVGLVVVRPNVLVIGVVGLLASQLDDGRDVVIALMAGWGVLTLWPHLFSTPVLMALGLFLPARERERAITERAARLKGLRAPEVVLLPLSLPNAFAFFGTHRVAYTTRLIELFDDHEIEAIALHEVGHLTETSTMRRWRVLGFVVSYSLAAVGWEWGRFGWPIALAHVMAVLILSRRRIAHVRAMEERADAIAHQHAHEGAYARTLERLYEVSLLPAVLARRGTHPFLYDRLLSAGVTPSYPRPLPPNPKRENRWTLLFFVVQLFALFVGRSVIAASTPAVVSAGLGTTYGLEDFEDAMLAQGASAAEVLPFEVLISERPSTCPGIGAYRRATFEARALRCEDAEVTVETWEEAHDPCAEEVPGLVDQAYEDIDACFDTP